MKLGIIPINVGLADPKFIAALAQHAEAVGLESVWTFEHVVVPVDYASRYPYDASGKMGAAPDTPFSDPLVTLAFVAGKTETLRLGTGVNILPQTNPLLLAKQAASLDMLSGGRFELGVGIGWLEEEYAAMGTPFERRGARFDDYIAAMKKVWSGEIVEHDGEFVRWSGFQSHPRPTQRPHMPVVIGGTSPRALRRVAQHGDGWFAPNRGLDALRELVVQLHEVARSHGRDPESIEVTAFWSPAREPDAVRAYEELGVSRLVAPLLATGEADPFRGIERVARG